MSVGFSLILPRDKEAGALARDAVRERLGDGLSASTLADVILAVSELVNNAVLHGGGKIELRVEVDDLGVKGEVTDEGGAFERRIREAGGIDGLEDRRGLSVVGKLSESWGVFQGTTHVWFEIPLAGGGTQLEEPNLGHPGDAQLPDA